MWGFWDSAHWRPQAAIAEGDNVTPNEAGQAYIRLMHEVICDYDVLIAGYLEELGYVKSPGHYLFRFYFLSLYDSVLSRFDQFSRR